MIFPPSMKSSMIKRSWIIEMMGGALSCVALFCVFVAPALAQVNAGLEPISNTIALGTTDIRIIIGNIIYVALGLLGIVLLVIIIYAGFLWMTSGGNEEQIAKAKKYLTNGVIGLIIILCSYAITYFVITRLMGVRDIATGGPGFEQGITSGFGDYGTGSLGEGIIQSHYPPPGATNISRNTKVIVTFKLPIDPATVIENGQIKQQGGKGSVLEGKLNMANARIVSSANLAPGGAFQTASDKLVNDVNAYTVDNKTFVFAPTQLLGSPTDKVSYTAALGIGIKLATGVPAFSGAYAGKGYHWEFETGTMVDTTPPKVVSVVPSPESTVARNSMIEITFDEAVDPTSASGKVPPFANVSVAASKGGTVDGTWEPANQYRTIGFRSNVKGGTNSCGDDIYVLPGGATISVKALAASVGAEAPQAAFYPPDGIADVSGNSLDANGNGKAEGPGAPPERDNFEWSFATTNVMDLTPPAIVSTDPGPETGNADLGKAIGMVFSKPLAVTTLNNQNLLFDTLPKLPLWYFGAGENLRPDGEAVQAPTDRVARTRALIIHERLAPTVGKCSDGPRRGGNCAVDADCPAAVCTKQAFSYYPKATSGVTDIYQNCFVPACGEDPARRYCCPTATGDVSCPTECVADPSSGRLYCNENK